MTERRQIAHRLADLLAPDSGKFGKVFKGVNFWILSESFLEISRIKAVQIAI